jgi:hypothetical protein
MTAKLLCSGLALACVLVFDATPQESTKDNSTTAPASHVSLEDLTRIPTGHTVHQFSSRNKEGYNGDDGWHLYDDDRGHAVIFDVEGPGCIRSIWSTDIRDDAAFHFYFDGEEEARYSIPMIGFFKGEHEFFPAPLVSYDRRGYWGDRPFAGNSYVPIPFAEGLKIAVSGELHFYHVIWESFPHGTEVETFTGAEDRGFVLGAFDDEPTWTRSSEKGLSDALTEWPATGPGEERVLGELTGPGCIREIRIEADDSEALLRETWIRMVFDGHTRWDVEAPLGYFFGSAVKPREMRSMPLRAELLEKGRLRLTCWFPMPFANGARVLLVNRSDQAIGRLQARITADSSSVPEDRIATFTTCFREGWTTYGRDWLLCESPGTGWYVGTVQTMLGEHYCEGDEHIAIDRAISPQINGTGSEDYYLGCFWPNREFNTPFACCVGDIREEAGSFEGSYGIRSCYTRYHLEAPIPFYSHLDARIQHGGYNTIRSSYGSLGFCYLRKRPSLVETDFIDVGGEASEALHGYTARDGNPTGWIVARGEGRDHLAEHRGRGRSHESGEISFTVAVDPQNRGVRLRRRLDQASPRQTAEVWIEGEQVGTWYHADHNDVLRWFDSDFDIHERFTVGKSSLEVRLVVVRAEGRGAFTDFEYRAFCFGE